MPLFTGGLVLDAFIDVHLKGLGLPSLGVNPLQVLSKGTVAHIAIKAPLRKWISPTMDCTLLSDRL